MTIVSRPTPGVEPLEQRIAPASGVIELATLDGENGFRLEVANVAEDAGYSVNAVGDFNGDGLSDAIIGAPMARGADGSLSGAAYVVFGNADGFLPAFPLDTLDGNNGFRINGSGDLSRTGHAVSGAGDVNGDGFDDLVIGAPAADGVGAAYLVFGRAGPFAPSFLLADLDGTTGFKMRGGMVDDAAGYAVSSAGDMNGDDFADVIIGAPGTLGNDEYDYGTGTAYVVFGRADDFPLELALEQLGATEGLRLLGEKEYDYAGSSVAGAGDVNGDGFGDVIVGAPGSNDDEDYASASVNAAGDKKHAYVVFGQRTAGGELRLAELNGTTGFQLSGEARNDYFGASVSSAGDMNGDGFADVIIGAPAGYDEVGPVMSFAYVVFGSGRAFPANVNVAAFDGRDGFRLIGTSGDYLGTTVGAAGDINGDGFDDAIITTDHDGGRSYLIFGKRSAFGPDIAVGTLGSGGLEIVYENPRDSRRATGANAGDLNGDGLDDLLLGAPAARAGGAAYVLFGTDAPLPPDPPVQPNPRTLIFTDVDGDRVKIKVSGGTLAPADLTLVREGVGARLVRLDLTGSQPGISLMIKAKRQLSAEGNVIGDDLVEVGEIDGTGVPLMNVSIDGDLTSISAGSSELVSINALDAASLGIARSKFPGLPAGLTVSGGLGKLKVTGDVADFNAVVGDGGEGFRKLVIGGQVVRSVFAVDGVFGLLRAKDQVANSVFAADGDFTKLVVRGAVSASGFEAGGSMHSAKLKAAADATVWKAGDMLGQLFVVGNLERSSVHAGRIVASLTVGGSMIDSTVSAGGVQLPLSAASAIALGGLRIHGDVVRSFVLAGYDAADNPVNADAAIGQLSITGDFVESSIAAGASAGMDGFFGSLDDALIAGGNPNVFAAIAAVTIKGAIHGSVPPGDHFGIVSEEILRLKIGAVWQPLTSGARNDLAGLALGVTGDVRAREVG